MESKRHTSLTLAKFGVALSNLMNKQKQRLKPGVVILSSHCVTATAALWKSPSVLPNLAGEKLHSPWSLLDVVLVFENIHYNLTDSGSFILRLPVFVRLVTPLSLIRPKGVLQDVPQCHGFFFLFLLNHTHKKPACYVLISVARQHWEKTTDQKSSLLLWSQRPCCYLLNLLLWIVRSCGYRFPEAAGV